MILGLTLILLCQLVGEAVAVGTGWPVPGPVIGMALLLGGLLLRDRIRAGPRAGSGQSALEGTAKGLLSHLSLLFVPAGVGVVQRLDVIAAHGIGLALVIVLSIVLALIDTAATFLLASRLVSRAQAQTQTEAGGRE